MVGLVFARPRPFYSCHFRFRPKGTKFEICISTRCARVGYLFSNSQTLRVELIKIIIRLRGRLGYLQSELTAHDVVTVSIPLKFMKKKKRLKY